MSQTAVQTFVGSTIALGYADAAEAAERLPGRDIAAGSAHLVLGDGPAESLGSTLTLQGVLHTGSPLVRPVRVELVLSPWSASRTEVGIRPSSKLGHTESVRTRRYLDAAWTVLPRLIDALGTVPATGRGSLVDAA